MNFELTIFLPLQTVIGWDAIWLLSQQTQNQQLHFFYSFQHCLPSQALQTP